MANKEEMTPEAGANRIIGSVDDAEQSALESVRRFLDVVTGVFPDTSGDGPGRKIIDAAFRMTEQLVGASNKLAQRIVEVTEHAMSEFEKRAAEGSGD